MLVVRRGDFDDGLRVIEIKLEEGDFLAFGPNNLRNQSCLRLSRHSINRASNLDDMVRSEKIRRDSHSM